jgi:hypothetical protein
MWPGIGEGAPAVISIVSSAPPARVVATLIKIMHVVNRIEVSFLIIPPKKLVSMIGLSRHL